MSTQDSHPTKAGRRKSLFQEAQERFLGVDHVGSVRHFEGRDLGVIVPAIKENLGSKGSNYEEQTEEIGGKRLYTNIAPLPTDDMTMWITATEVENVGVVLDAKLFHSTELSAVADEYLSSFFSEIEMRVLKGGEGA